jgi:hypothetical protein
MAMDLKRKKYYVAIALLWPHFSIAKMKENSI